jgi:uncharacterized protein (TIGR00725 family)
MKRIVAVSGGGDASPEEEELAFQVGLELAKRGVTLLCGGLGGVMAAAARGAHQGGGTTIGILPGSAKRSANVHIDYAIPTGMTDARNLIIALGGDALIAVGGRCGTLSEIALALKNGVPVVGLRTWNVDFSRCEQGRFYRAKTPREAVEEALRHAGGAMPNSS